MPLGSTNSTETTRPTTIPVSVQVLYRLRFHERQCGETRQGNGNLRSRIEHQCHHPAVELLNSASVLWVVRLRRAVVMVPYSHACPWNATCLLRVGRFCPPVRIRDGPESRGRRRTPPRLRRTRRSCHGLVGRRSRLPSLRRSRTNTPTSVRYRTRAWPRARYPTRSLSEKQCSKRYASLVECKDANYSTTKSRLL